MPVGGHLDLGYMYSSFEACFMRGSMALIPHELARKQQLFIAEQIAFRVGDLCYGTATHAIGRLYLDVLVGETSGHLNDG